MDEPLTTGDLKRAVADFRAFQLLGSYIDPARVVRAGPRPRGRWHMLTHRKKRIRKKWARRLALVRQAELEWSLRSGVILDQGRLLVLRSEPFDSRPQWVRRLEIATGKQWIGPAKQWLYDK